LLDSLLSNEGEEELADNLIAYIGTVVLIHSHVETVIPAISLHCPGVMEI
jgi:hypothetical protein